MEGSFSILPEVQINDDNVWFGEMKFRRTFFNIMNDLGSAGVKKINAVNVKKILVFEAREQYWTDEQIVNSRKF
ncbi:hypothetical protein SAMN05421856_10173 [Chryseobacterium taichungense]|uniref:Uncharacterized protein n=1 Tax=Chryseobacterium taichungense TaxID=295069 RepID=A0A1H7VK32_9FLAO|nr:hypothetical protein SAMN05421856_10173 [Chryseobacterium taichungense]